MQIGFSDAPVKLVDLSATISQGQLSKVSSIYIDATNSTHDVTVLFPLTGFQTRIMFGDSAMVPILTTTASPKFYVILDDGNVTNATDTVNIFALNFFVPPYETNTYQRSIGYGYGQMQSIVPVLAQSTSFTVNGVANAGAATIINAHQWYITSMNINTLLTSSGSTNGFTVQLYDNGTPFWSYSGAVSGEQGFLLSDVAGLNYVSSGNGNLTGTLTGTLASGGVTFNIGGGILVS